MPVQHLHHPSRRSLLTWLPNSTLAVIADAAHMTCIEQPERFNRVLRIFLDSTVGASSEAL